MFLQRIDNHYFTDIFVFIICEIMWNDLRLPFLQFLIHSNQYPRLTVISGSKGWSTEVSSSEMGGEERRCIDAFSNVNSAKVNEKDKGRILSLLADNKLHQLHITSRRWSLNIFFLSFLCLSHSLKEFGNVSNISPKDFYYTIFKKKIILWLFETSCI